jgi:hypothetical protein
MSGGRLPGRKNAASAAIKRMAGAMKGMISKGMGQGAFCGDPGLPRLYAASEHEEKYIVLA